MAAPTNSDLTPATAQAEKTKAENRGYWQGKATPALLRRPKCGGPGIASSSGEATHRVGNWQSAEYKTGTPFPYSDKLYGTFVSTVPESPKFLASPLWIQTFCSELAEPSINRLGDLSPSVPAY
eukprot:425702-Rhodomonas_salina.1